MFQLLQPIWLFAMAGISIPIFIHLWNIRKGKVLRVGSISLLQESARQQARSFKLKDILLLILRCLLIILLSFLLAKPMWQRQLKTTSEKGWMLIEKQGMSEAYKNYKPLIDSLTKSGFKFHYFNRDFTETKFADALKAPVDTSKVDELSYWILLKRLNEEVPAELPVYLFTNNQLKRFESTRPAVTTNLKWLTYTSADTAATMILKSYKTSTGSNRIVVVNSRSNATYYTSENLKEDNSDYNSTSAGNNIFVSSKDSPSYKISLDSDALKVGIYTDKFMVDANYLAAAIEAIQQYTNLRILLSVSNNVGEIKPGNDWLFWLSDKPLPSQKFASNVFAYAQGEEQETSSWISSSKTLALTQQPIQLSRSIQDTLTSADALEPVWKDGYGHALLSLEKTDRNTYYFHSRFNPSWNDLPWSSHFVEMLFELVIESNMSMNEFDKRTIDRTQLQPQVIKDYKAFDKEKFVEKSDLTKVFWLIAFIILCLERYIAFYTGKSESVCIKK